MTLCGVRKNSPADARGVLDRLQLLVNYRFSWKIVPNPHGSPRNPCFFRQSVTSTFSASDDQILRTDGRRTPNKLCECKHPYSIRIMSKEWMKKEKPSPVAKLSQKGSRSFLWPFSRLPRTAAKYNVIGNSTWFAVITQRIRSGRIVVAETEKGSRSFLRTTDDGWRARCTTR